jgi:hypothetical protein
MEEVVLNYVLKRLLFLFTQPYEKRIINKQPRIFKVKGRFVCFFYKKGINIPLNKYSKAN